MIAIVECAGAPRDLGLDQGSACGAAIRDALAQRGMRLRGRLLPDLRRLSSGAVLGAGAGREALRHYPHLAERLSGIARASWVPLDSLMELLLAAGYGDPLGALAQPTLALVADSAGGSPVLGRALEPGAPWILRRSRPEVGFRSVELTLPWLSTSVAGVNERGIAVAAVCASDSWRMRGLGAPPAWLLVQECLQRFEALEAAIEWCLKRPAAGALALLLGDAAGESAVVEVSGSERRLARVDEGYAVAGGPESARAALRKLLAEGIAPGLELLASDELAGPAAAQVWLDTRDRRLRFAPADSGDAAGTRPAVVTIQAED